MPRNVYFSQGTTPEKTLHEDIVIEALKIYGHDVYYIPRTIVNTNAIFNEDELSKFGSAYQIEMYVENTDGFEGDGDLLGKFGVEVRDSMTLVLSTRRWSQLVGRFQDPVEARPQEGDLIYFPLVQGLFEIRFVEDESPFYQLQGLPTFKLTCETFEYGNEALDTGIPGIDTFETSYATQTTLTLGSGSGAYQVGEDVTQTNGSITITGEVATVPTATFTTLTASQSGAFTSSGTGAASISGSGFDTSATHVKVSGVTVAEYNGIFPVTFITSSSLGYNVGKIAEASGGTVGCTVEVGRLGYSSGATIEITSQIASDGSNTLFNVSNGSTIGNIIGGTSASSYAITSIDAFNSIDDNDAYADNVDFETIGNNFIDFSEENPFGKPNITS